MDGVLKFTTVPKKLDLKELDFFSEGVGLKMAGEDRAKSYLGMFTTLCLYTLLGLSTYYYLTQFLDESSPKIQYNRMIKPIANSFVVNEMGAYYFFLIGNPSSKLRPASAEDGVTGDDSGERRRRLQAVKPANLYLSQPELKKYFVTSLAQEIIQFQTNPTGGEDYQVVQSSAKSLIPCSQAEWFKDPKFKDALNENEFVLQLLTKYGICMQLDNNVKMFGDQLSRKSSRIRFKLDFCPSTNTDCLADGFSDILKASGLNMIVGSFEPSVDNSNKTNPWSYALNVDTQINIESLSTATVTVAMKSIECLTDKGVVISDVDNQTRAAIDAVKKDFTASFEFGESMNDALANLPTPVTPAEDQYSVQYIPNEMTYVDVRFVASRTTEQFQRTYDTILDLFGNIGGSLDFVIIIFVILFNWCENLLTDRTLTKQIGQALQVPEKMMGNHKRQGCCSKKNRTAPSADEHKEPTKLDGCNDAIADITDKSLSVENLAVQSTTYEFMVDNMMPAHLKTLIPLTVFVKKMVEQKKEEEKKKHSKNSAVGDNKSLSEYNMASTKDMTSVQEASDEKLTIAEAFENLDKPVDPLFAGMNKEIKRAFAEFAVMFGIQDIKGYLREEDGHQTPTQGALPAPVGRVEDFATASKAQQSVELSNVQFAKEDQYTSLKKKGTPEGSAGPTNRANLNNLIKQN